MSWIGYVTSLMDRGYTVDAAIVGCLTGQESVWAAHPGGDFERITPHEIQRLLIKDRGELFSNGLTLANTKCTVLRDRLNEDGVFTMDLRTKGTELQPDTFNICVGKSGQALVLVKGKKDVHGGKLNPMVDDMAAYLRKANL
ncbi:profilin-1 [Paramormyrops kingsleyae]|uniref:Profilin n=1 Tax=Paramormyrops kingsleyae TaxID=1676925 RepID=A0A3B3RU52_9TELE|nr:profilin-1 [Paramormyrops kingsleyae]XP_023659361.1 profilin-1 [Paramormyrops kingsleyae]